MSSRVFWGFVLLVTGGVLLASNLGLVSWGVWATLWRVWPVLLILWGVSFLLRPLGRAGAFITAVVVLAAAAGVICYAYYFGAFDNPSAADYSLDQDLIEGVERVELDIDFGAGKLRLDGEAPAGKLAVGTLEFVGFSPRVNYEAEATAAALVIGVASGNWTVPPAARAPEWDIHLSPVPSYMIDLKLGACDADIDLSTLNVTELDLKAGAADTEVIFGDNGAGLTGSVDMGAASVTLRIPRSVAVKITLDSGLSGSNLEEAGFSKQGGSWLSAGYEARTTHYEFTVKAGVSSFEVEWID